MTTRLRAVVVDDSALARLMVREALRKAGDVAVVGNAADGLAALDEIARLNPDLVTLDVEMPRLNGIEVLRQLRQRGDRARVVMVSRHTSEGAAVTAEALLEGAFDFLAKPQGADPEASRQRMLEDLQRILPAVKASLDGVRQPHQETRDADEPQHGRQTEFVLIGCSTGGPDALRQLLPGLSHDCSAAFAVVQHMPAGLYTERLAARLNELTHLDVMLGRDGLELAPGRVILAPGGRHMGLLRRGDRVVVRLADGPPEHRCRPAFDVLLRSAFTAIPDRRVVALVLTGMGSDGTAGCELIRQNGGRVYAQHSDGCVVYGMPRAVIDAGHVDRVIPLSRMAAAVNGTRW